MIKLFDTQKITKSVIAEILKLAQKQNGKRRTRVIDQHEVDQFVKLLRKHRQNPETHTIRVYADGFVPNSYKYRAEMTRLTAMRTAPDCWTIAAETVDAKRSYGEGSTVTLNDRAA